MTQWKKHTSDTCPIPGAQAGQYEIRTEAGRTSFPKCPADRAGWSRITEPGGEFINIEAYRDLRPTTPV